MSMDFECSKCNRADVNVILKDYVSHLLHDERVPEFLQCTCRRCGNKWREKPGSKTKLQNRLEEAEKALSFYADKSTWGKTNKNHFNRTHFDDIEFFKSHEYQGVWYSNGEIAGKTAREYFDKYSKESER